MIKKIDLRNKKIKIAILVLGVILTFAILFSLSKAISFVSGLKAKEVYVSNASEVEFHDDLADDSGIKVLDSFSVKKNQNHCINGNGICIIDVSISCYEDKGIINYHVVNSTGLASNGYFKMTLGNDEYTAIGYYSFTDKVPPKYDEGGNLIESEDTNKHYYGFATFEDFDLRNIEKSYKIEVLSDDDKTGLVNFYFSNETGFYEILNSGSSE